MNRLIIIGNGFDLAHDLKTSFHDFIVDYFFGVWKELINGSFKDQLIEVNSAKEYFRENDLNFSSENTFNIFNKILKEYSYNTSEPHMKVKSNFFKSVFLKMCDLKWADIEIEYYNELIHILDKTIKDKATNIDRIGLERNTLRQIRSLNSDLDYIQKLLIDYLEGQQRWFEKNGKENSSLKDCFNEQIIEEDVDGKLLKLYDIKERKYLNFNYTNTLSAYTHNTNIINIHGTLKTNPIFGFGDDTSDRYKMLENEYNNEILRKIKSFKYLKNSNYYKLINFIKKGEFQVHIYGHSCGVTDRTLLKQIFENEQCKSIKIFYYNEQDFDEKMFELSRHFENKINFLNKVVPFDKLSQMPQPKEKMKILNSN